jgi:hypothetical protein
MIVLTGNGVQIWNCCNVALVATKVSGELLVEVGLTQTT